MDLPFMMVAMVATGLCVPTSVTGDIHPSFITNWTSKYGFIRAKPMIKIGSNACLISWAENGYDDS